MTCYSHSAFNKCVSSRWFCMQGKLVMWDITHSSSRSIYEWNNTVQPLILFILVFTFQSLLLGWIGICHFWLFVAVFANQLVKCSSCEYGEWCGCGDDDDTIWCRVDPTVQQATDAAGRGLLYRGVAHCFIRTFATEGIWGFYKGCGALFFRIGPHTVLSLVFWNQMQIAYQSFSWAAKTKLWFICEFRNFILNS